MELIKSFSGPGELDLPVEVIEKNDKNLVEVEKFNNKNTKDYEAFCLQTERRIQSFYREINNEYELVIDYKFGNIKELKEFVEELPNLPPKTTVISQTSRKNTLVHGVRLARDMYPGEVATRKVDTWNGPGDSISDSWAIVDNYNESKIENDLYIIDCSFKKI